MMMHKTLHTSTDIRDEITVMLTTPEFTGRKADFSKVTDTLVTKSGMSGEQAWDTIKGKIIQFLPDYITEGLIHCSFEEIGKQDACRNAGTLGKTTHLRITPGKNFPEIRFKTFYPYLDFILTIGPLELFHHKIRFKVEGTMVLKDATIRFTGTAIEKISGTIHVSLIISLCKGRVPIMLHRIDKPIIVS
jgi:hypothetical protein